MTAPGPVCPPETAQDRLADYPRPVMATESNRQAATEGVTSPAPLTLALLLDAVERAHSLSDTRRRDLRSAVRRVAHLLDNEPGAIPLDLRVISEQLVKVNLAVAGLTAKRMANVRSDFLCAVKISGLSPFAARGKPAVSLAWRELLWTLVGRHARIGLARLARHASARGLSPQDIDEAAIAGFITAVREGSLHRKPNVLHRQVTVIWNTVARDSKLRLRPVSVPSFRRPPRWIDWASLPAAFRNDVDAYLFWCGGSDPFAENARLRALKPATLQLRRHQIHTAVSALVTSGVKPADILSLAGLVTPDHFKRVLRRRLEMSGGRGNAFNFNLGTTLVQIAREWVKVDATVLAELKRLFSKLPAPAKGLTTKNKKFLRQYDDPRALRRLVALPDRLWSEVRREAKPNARTLTKVQAAIGIAILIYMPLRLRNLAHLAFDVHLFVRGGAGAISTLELPSSEVKNEVDLAFEIPLPVAKMLTEYHERIAPRIIGHRPQELFVRMDGTRKRPQAVASLIASYVKTRTGLELTVHQLRHLSVKILLDAEPGSFELARQLLGHKSLKTTVGFYAGIDSRRAGRHHQRLIEQALAVVPPLRSAQKSSPSASKGRGGAAVIPLRPGSKSPPPTSR